jgi:D-alanyl-D-alanine dipeptidase
MKTLFLFLWAFSAQAGIQEELEKLPRLVDVSQWEGVELDIRYSTPNNFMKRDVYGDFAACFLHQKAANSLKRVLEQLKNEKPGWKLRVFDCLRPRRVQRILWSVVEGTPQERYVANPDLGSIHNYGFAVDLSLSDENGREVDMGTKYDYFGPLAEPRHEEEFLRRGKLSARQVENRRLLRSILGAGSFKVISNEWWHFEALPGSVVRKNYPIVE